MSSLVSLTAQCVMVPSLQLFDGLFDPVCRLEYLGERMDHTAFRQVSVVFISDNCIFNELGN